MEAEHFRCAQVCAALPKKIDARQATVGLNVQPSEWDQDLRWELTVWPQSRDSIFARGMWLIGQNLGCWEMSFAHQHSQFLLPLLDPDEPFTENALTLLALALCSKDQKVGTLALDVLIAAIEDGRLSGPMLGGALAHLRRKPPDFDIVIPRWTARLKAAAAVSVLHSQIVRATIEHMLISEHPRFVPDRAARQVIDRAALRALKEAPRDIHAALDLLYELSVQAKDGLHTAARSYLDVLSGAGGKTGKLARALLALNQTPGDAGAAARLHALENRIERAGRWELWSKMPRA